MKKNLYTYVSGILLLVLFYVSPTAAQAQACSGLHATYITSESRCMATGTITVQASGGSGNYNYKAVGPLTTSFTSANVITGLQAGVYKVIVRDITRNCQIEQDSIVVNGTYSDPRFVLTGTDVTCAGKRWHHFGGQPAIWPCAVFLHHRCAIALCGRHHQHHRLFFRFDSWRICGAVERFLRRHPGAAYYHTKL